MIKRKFNRKNEQSSFWRKKKVLVTGGAGFLGSRIVEELKRRNVKEIIIPRSRNNDLRVLENCKKSVKGIDLIIHAAGEVGGIGLNQEKPGELFYNNLIMGAQLLEEARKAGVEKFVTIGTVCEYPKFTPVPFREKDLWDGYPAEATAPYALAKKILLVQGQSYRQQYGFNSIHILEANLYGPGDNFNPQTSHVIPALIKKFVDAKEQDDKKVVVWGTGKATREFLYVDDAAEGIVMAAEKYNGSDPINIGAFFEISIRNLARLIGYLTGFRGKIVWDKTKPDGQPRRKMDATRAFKEFGFKSKISFEEGLKKTIDWYFETKDIPFKKN